MDWLNGAVAVLSLVYLGVLSYLDLKSDGHVPGALVILYFLFAVTFGIWGYLVVGPEMMLIPTCVLIILLGARIFGKLGEADVLLLTALALLYPNVYFMARVLIITLMIGVGYVIARRLFKAGAGYFPFIPCIFIAYLMTCVTLF